MFQAGMFPRQKKSFFFLVANHFRSMTIRSYSLTSNAAQKEKKKRKRNKRTAETLVLPKSTASLVFGQSPPLSTNVTASSRGSHRIDFLIKKKRHFLFFSFFNPLPILAGESILQGFPFAVLGNVPHQLIESSILHGWSMADDGKSEFNHLESRKNPHWQIESMGAAIT